MIAASGDRLLNVYVTPFGMPSAVGVPFQSTCVATELVHGLTQQPSATWLYHSNREPVVNSSDVMKITSRNSSTGTAVLIFPAFLQSQSLQYICVGSIMSLGETATGEIVFSYLSTRCKS